MDTVTIINGKTPAGMTKEELRKAFAKVDRHESRLFQRLGQRYGMRTRPSDAREYAAKGCELAQQWEDIAEQRRALIDESYRRWGREGTLLNLY